MKIDVPQSSERRCCCWVWKHPRDSDCHGVGLAKTTCARRCASRPRHVFARPLVPEAGGIVATHGTPSADDGWNFTKLLCGLFDCRNIVEWSPTAHGGLHRHVDLDSVILFKLQCIGAFPVSAHYENCSCLAALSCCCCRRTFASASLHPLCRDLRQRMSQIHREIVFSLLMHLRASSDGVPFQHRVAVLNLKVLWWVSSSTDGGRRDAV